MLAGRVCFEELQGNGIKETDTANTALEMIVQDFDNNMLVINRPIQGLQE